MSKRRRLLSVPAAVLLLSSSAALRAQTTGRIQGQTLDVQGAVVPGATITIISPALQGSLTQVTDAEGRFRFATVPPGIYAVKAELSDFKTFNQTDVDVGLDRTVTLTMTMEVGAVAETVTVEASSPVIDTPSTTIGVNATAEIFNRLPVQRDIYSIARRRGGIAERRRRTGSAGIDGR